jgi:hypothetical protein
MKIQSLHRRFLPAFSLAVFFILLTATMGWGQSEPVQDVPDCRLGLCYRSSQYYLNNYKRLRLFPRDIFISGVNLNHPVDCVAQPGPIIFALRANSLNYSFSPLAWFNQQYVAAQLAQAQVPLLTVYSATKSALGCYGLNFEPVKLSTDVVITPNTTLAELFTQCDLTGIAADSAERDADLGALARILSMLNNTCQ